MKQLERIFDLLNIAEANVYRGDTNDAIDALQSAKFELSEWLKTLPITSKQNPSKQKQRGDDDRSS